MLACGESLIAAAGAAQERRREATVLKPFSTSAYLRAARSSAWNISRCSMRANASGVVNQ